MVFPYKVDGMKKSNLLIIDCPLSQPTPDA